MAAGGQDGGASESWWVAPLFYTTVVNGGIDCECMMIDGWLPPSATVNESNVPVGCLNSPITCLGNCSPRNQLSPPCHVPIPTVVRTYGGFIRSSSHTDDRLTLSLTLFRSGAQALHQLHPSLFLFVCVPSSASSCRT